jgi:hypothetical protein
LAGVVWGENKSGKFEKGRKTKERGGEFKLKGLNKRERGKNKGQTVLKA